MIKEDFFMSITPKKVLIIDNDKKTVKKLDIYLKSMGNILEIVEYGKIIIKKFLEFNPDLILFEVNMPKINGIKLLQCIKRKKDVPVIILTTKRDIFHKVVAFEIGCDDYILKPFECKELIARMNVVFKRYSHNDNDVARTIKVDDLCINPLSQTVTVDDKDIKMTKKEFELLYILAKNKNKILTKKQLLYDIWGYKYIRDSKIIECNIQHILNKTSKDKNLWKIERICDFGYRFLCSDESVNC